jgi:hypothetical protein
MPKQLRQNEKTLKFRLLLIHRTIQNFIGVALEEEIGRDN